MRRVVELLVGFVLAAGCSGSIGDRMTASGAPPGSSGVGGSNNGGGSGGGSGGGAGTGPTAAADPGRVTMHRLNRVEYENTVFDLLGVDINPAEEFPSDDRGYGFDNIADVLSLSPLHLEMYQRAAEKISEAALGAQRARFVTCDLTAAGETCGRSILGAFARRAWRRPVTEAELVRLTSFVSVARGEGLDAEAGVKLGLQAILISPHFIFRVETDPAPTSLIPHLLSSHELASRLSYFLWSSMPDDELFSAADANQLTNEQAVSAEVTRMLRSPKAQALIDNFAGQWLHIRKLDDHEPDYNFFRDYDAPLRDAFRRETVLMFREVLLGNLSADQLLTADFTFANDRLAKHYGLPPVGSTDHKRVSLAGTRRGGLLTQGSILTVTSYPARTSPVQRGRWVLEQLLCQPPPAPPPGVEGLKPEVTPTGSLRQRTEQHRANPTCASCHKLMDPIGFGLENYDGIGAYRTSDSGFAIDSTGALPDGRTFDGALALSRILATDPRFARCMTEQMYVYALGRGLSDAAGHMDTSTVDAIARRFASEGFNVPRLIEMVATADTFRKRRGEPDTGGSL